MNNEPSGLASLLASTHRDRFAPGFADRVMRRMQRASALTLGSRMQRPFRVLVPAAVAAILLLGLLNLRATRGQGRSTVDALLGLPAVTLEAAYAFDSGQ